MNTLEHLEDEACKDGVEVIDYQFDSENIKGLYCDGVVGLNNQIRTTSEKSCVLAEELGHHHTTIGDIIDQSDTMNRKQERQARLWAYNKMIGLTGIIKAYKSHCSNSHEIAEFLGVTEDFFKEAIECYRQKYGLYKSIDNYIIYFEPLVVLELFTQE